MMKAIIHFWCPVPLNVLLFLSFPVILVAGTSASESAPLARTEEQKGNWLQRHLEARLLQREQDNGPKDFRWKFTPGVGFRMRRRGRDWSVGPRLGLFKRTSEQGQLRLNVDYLPIRFADLKSESRIDYSRFDVGYRRFFNSRLYAGVGFAFHRFDPSGAFREEVVARGGTAKDELIRTTSITLAHQVFKIAWSFRGRRGIWPFFLELTQQFSDDFNYGSDLGSAGFEYKMRSGFSVRIRPLSKMF